MSNKKYSLLSLLYCIHNQTIGQFNFIIASLRSLSCGIEFGTSDFLQLWCTCSSYDGWFFIFSICKYEKAIRVHTFHFPTVIWEIFLGMFVKKFFILKLYVISYTQSQIHVFDEIFFHNVEPHDNHQSELTKAILGLWIYLKTRFAEPYFLFIFWKKMTDEALGLAFSQRVLIKNEKIWTCYLLALRIRLRCITFFAVCVRFKWCIFKFISSY